ncbi:MAG: hypothetical protein U0R65_07900 [Candidatus Nanopelagicales bacterium]
MSWRSLSTHLPLAVWSVTRVENGQQTYVYLEESNAYGLVRGSSTPWGQTFRIHAVASRTPSVTAQAPDVPGVPGEPAPDRADGDDLRVRDDPRAGRASTFGTVCSSIRRP